MENASKALLMAGGILIALMVIGALVLLGNNLSNYKSNEDISVHQAQIAEFNNQFEPYNKKDLTLMELKSVYNKIKSNNALKPEYEIETNIEEVYENISGDFKTLPEEDKQTKVFACTEIQRNGVDGRISKMEFEDVTPEKNQP